MAFRLEVPPEPLRRVTDASRLRQILDGLLDNALRVTPAGAPIVLAVAEPSRTRSWSRSATAAPA